MKKIVFDYKFVVEKRVLIDIDKLVDFLDTTDTSLYDVIKKYIYRYKSSFYTIENKYEVENDIEDLQIIDTISVKKYDYDDFKDEDDLKDHIENIIDNFNNYLIKDFTFEDLKKLKNKKLKK